MTRETPAELRWQQAYKEWWTAAKNGEHAKAQALMHPARHAWMDLTEPERDGAWERYVARYEPWRLG